MIRKRYTPAQKAVIVLELFKEEETLPQIASRHGVHPNLLRKWKAQALEGLPHLFTDDQQDKRALATEHQGQLDELYGEIGRLTTRLAWLKKNLASNLAPLERAPSNLERPPRDEFPGLTPEVNLQLTTYRLYRFFVPWPMPGIIVSGDESTGVGQVEKMGDLKVQLRSFGQAQAWFGRDFGVLWEYYFHKAERMSNWQDELAAIWQTVEGDIGVRKVFTLPHDPAFDTGYTDFLIRVGYGRDPDYPQCWSKAMT